MTTREKIIEAALDLFSTRGYEGVSVKDIASAVGIKDSSLYKHFKSKREIFDTIMTVTSEKMDELSRILKLPDVMKEDGSGFYGRISVDLLVDISKKAFLFYLKDSYAARFRRMVTIEQYKSTEVSSVYRKVFMEDSLDFQTELFQQMIKSGYFKKSDPEVVALNFYSPIFYLLSRYDLRPEYEDEALALLEKHVRQFAKTYSR